MSPCILYYDVMCVLTVSFYFLSCSLLSSALLGGAARAKRILTLWSAVRRLGWQACGALPHPWRPHEVHVQPVLGAQSPLRKALQQPAGTVPNLRSDGRMLYVATTECIHSFFIMKSFIFFSLMLFAFNLNNIFFMISLSNFLCSFGRSAVWLAAWTNKVAKVMLLATSKTSINWFMLV